MSANLARSRLLVCLAMFGGLACTAEAPLGSGTLPPGAIRLEPSAIIDSTGFEQPMAAATLFLPHGWTTAGGVLWGAQFQCTNGYVFDWSATAPDGLTRLAVLPHERWEWNNFGAGVSTPGCPSAALLNAQQYLTDRVQRMRPGARLLGCRPRDDLRQQFASLESYTPMAMGDLRTWVEAGEATFSWSEGGQEMRGSLAAVVVFSLTRTDSGGGWMESVSAGTFPAYATCAPQERHDPAFFEAIRRSIKLDPRWETRINKHNNSIAQVALRETIKRGEMIRQSNEEIARIREDAWNNYQESSDRRMREFGEVIRGVETYRDPDASAGEVQLSHLYDHAWRLNDGSYILTNDVGFDPWRELGVEGRQLEAQP